MENVAGRKPNTTLGNPAMGEGQTYVIIGGGAAGNSCAETLRRQGFLGKILLYTEENFIPYNRVALSKNVKADANNISLRTNEFYEEKEIEIIKGTKVMAINDSAKLIVTPSGPCHYDKLCIATGAKAKIP